MRRLDTSKKMNLPKGRTFHAEYARVTRSQLSDKVIMKRKFKTRAASKGRRRRTVKMRQRGQAFFSSLKK